MTVKLNRGEGYDITDPDELDELKRALGERGVILIFHPSGSVWQLEGAKIEGGNTRLLKNCRKSVETLLERFGIVDDPESISADPN